jgi:hypothetical protein
MRFNMARVFHASCRAGAGLYTCTMKLQTIILSTFTLTACLEGDALDDEALSVEESALCLAATSPGAPSQSALVTSTGSQAITASNYGTSECSRTTVEFRSTEHVNVTVPPITTQAACEGTRVFATFFYDDSGGSFIRDGIHAESGVWMGTYCREPVIRYTVPLIEIPPQGGAGGSTWVPLPRDVRVVVSAKRTTCTSSGLCGTTYGLPVRSIGWR